MAIVPKMVTDIRSNTAAAATFQPASGKEWWWTDWAWNYNLTSGGSYDYIVLQKSNGTTHRGHKALGPDNAMATAYFHGGFADKQHSHEPISTNSGGWFTNTWYMRIICGAASTSNWWQFAFFGVEIT